MSNPVEALIAKWRKDQAFYDAKVAEFAAVTEDPSYWEGKAQVYKNCTDELASALASLRPSPEVETLKDAAEMLWVVLANVSGGDWTQQTPEWQEAAARWRDKYFESLASLRGAAEKPQAKRDWCADGGCSDACEAGRGAAEPEQPVNADLLAALKAVLACETRHDARGHAYLHVPARSLNDLGAEIGAIVANAERGEAARVPAPPETSNE